MRSTGGRSSPLYQDYKDLLSAFQSHGVKYLVVGGFAVIYHAQPRSTNYMDLFIKPDLENAKAAFKPLAAFGAPLQGIQPETSPTAIADAVAVRVLERTRVDLVKNAGLPPQCRLHFQTIH